MLFLEICSIHIPYLERIFTECISIASFITITLSILSNTHLTHPEMLYSLLEVLTAIFHSTNETMKYAVCNQDLLESIDNLQVREHFYFFLPNQFFITYFFVIDDSVYNTIEGD